MKTCPPPTQNSTGRIRCPDMGKTPRNASPGVPPCLDIRAIFSGAKSSLSPVHLFIKDEQKRWVFLNDASCRLLGIPATAILGKTGKNLIPKPLAELFSGNDALALAGGKPHISTCSIDWKGHRRTFRQITWLHHEGECRFIVGTLRDITREEEHLHEMRSRDSILAAVGKAGQTPMAPYLRCNILQ